MNTRITCFLPCRKGSQRVPRKNIKPFAGYPFGLIEVKIKQLVQSSTIDEIVLSTNDEDILNYASSLNISNLHIHERIAALSSDQTSTDQLVAHALELIPEGDILWTHVTSPFINAHHYDHIVHSYRDKVATGYDSLMTVTELYGFLWQNEEPMNYDREQEKWPRTQTLTPIHEVNSGAFLASSDIYSRMDDRVGKRPYLYILDKLTSHDIDWPEDFVVAECMVEKGLVDL